MKYIRQALVLLVNIRLGAKMICYDKRDNFLHLIKLYSLMSWGLHYKTLSGSNLCSQIWGKDGSYSWCQTNYQLVIMQAQHFNKIFIVKVNRRKHCLIITLSDFVMKNFAVEVTKAVVKWKMRWWGVLLYKKEQTTLATTKYNHWCFPPTQKPSFCSNTEAKNCLS